MTTSNTALAHAGRTLQDVLNEMSPAQRDLHDTIVGAAVNKEDLSEFPEILTQFSGLSTLHKELIAFSVGNAIAEAGLEHDAISDVDVFLAHYGVKGMKWGVRKRVTAARDAINPPNSLSRSSANTPVGRAVAKTRVARGTATKKEEHLASLKSTGHRAVNALSGDKLFWKRMAVTAGITTASVAAGLVGAYALPDGVLSSIGKSGIDDILAGDGGSPSIEKYSSAKGDGQFASAVAGIYVGGAALAGGTVANVVGNTSRAVAGNTLINRNYNRVSKQLADRQRTGRERAADVLKTITGTRDKDLRQSGIMEWDEYLEHFGVKGMKWGVRKSRVSTTGASSLNRANAKEQREDQKRDAARRAAAGDSSSTSKSNGVDTEALKVVGKEVAKAAVKYGLPAGAIALGAGIPLAATLGVSVKVLDDPAVKEALAPVGSAVKSMTKAVGDIPMPEIPKVKSPFSVKTTRTKPDFNANYINGEWPMHRSPVSGDLVPNPDYVGLKK